MDWQLHWLEAEGDLGSWHELIASEVEAAQKAVARVLPPPRLDILAQRGSLVIPEIGMVGQAYRKGLFALTFDPDNPNFARCLSNGTLRRQVAHEVHHCLRMGGPGYGRTLGEALVSEGLAGRFVGCLFDNPPEPWECAVEDEILRDLRPDAAALASSDYHHAAWFFGTKDGRFPRWLGYTLGYRIVGDWLAAMPGLSGDMWVNVSAETVLTAARSRILATDL